MNLDTLQKKRIGKILFWFISFIVFALFFWQKNVEIVTLQEKNKELLKILRDNNIKIEEKKVEKKEMGIENQEKKDKRDEKKLDQLKNKQKEKELIKKEDVETENNDKKQNP